MGYCAVGNRDGRTMKQTIEVGPGDMYPLWEGITPGQRYWLPVAAADTSDSYGGGLYVGKHRQHGLIIYIYQGTANDAETVTVPVCWEIS